jgi:arylsulfatase A-like enzyme
LWFWSPSLAEENSTGAPFTSPDILPTILNAMGIPATAPMDGRAHSLD